LGYENSRLLHNEATSPEGGPAMITIEEVDDYLCWTIVGIGKLKEQIKMMNTSQLKC
jgi:hypothetical protein